MFHLHRSGHSEKRGRSSWAPSRIRRHSDQAEASMWQGRSKSLSMQQYQAMLLQHTGPSTPPHRTATPVLARLQIVLQIFVDELELRLSAVHPGDGDVREW
jgi:hypothetical protein